MHLVLVAKLTRALQIDRVVHRHASRALDQRFYDEGGQLRMMPLQMLREHIRAAQRVILRSFTRSGLAPVRAGHRGLLPDQFTIRSPKQRDVGDRQRPQCLAVIAVFQADELRLVGFAAVAPVMRAHLERDLRGRRPVGGIEAMPETGGRQFAQTLRELHHRFMGEARQHHVFQCFQLVVQCGIDVRVAVAEQVHPPGTDRIEVAFLVAVIQPDAARARDRQQREALVMFHLRTGVPHGRETAGNEVGIVLRTICHARNHSGFCGLRASPGLDSLRSSLGSDGNSKCIFSLPAAPV